MTPHPRPLRSRSSFGIKPALQVFKLAFVTTNIAPSFLDWITLYISKFDLFTAIPKLQWVGVELLFFSEETQKARVLDVSPLIR